MAGQRPDLKITVRGPEGALKELVAVWKSSEKEHLHGKIHVTEEMAELFKRTRQKVRLVCRACPDRPEPQETLWVTAQTGASFLQTSARLWRQAAMEKRMGQH